jgi:chemotaxis protein methyltransferase CheR
MTSSPVPTPIAPMVSLKQVTDAELSRYASLIYERTGIRVSPNKKMLLSNRLRRRLRGTGIDGFESYYRYLKDLRPNHAEWDAFLQEITTHETYLFRDEHQWEWLRNAFLPATVAAARSDKGRPSLRIWSAACSTGDEAYTIACCVAAAMPNRLAWSIDILGTDIGVGAIEQARGGAFGERAMRLVPPEYRRYFVRVKESWEWKAKPVLSGMTRFRQHNLMDLPAEKPFDLVFLKNVLIYFDAASKRTVLKNVGSVIRPGGLLVVGAAEGVGDLIKDYARVEPWLYQRPADDRSES